MNQKDFVYQLMQKNIIKYGDFTLKSGQKSHIYFDLRTLIAHPLILNHILDTLFEKYIKNLTFKHICGLAYTGIPMASGISLKYNIPMLMVRKERKEYGTKKLIEGLYNTYDMCLIIDDVITTGSSLIENIKILKKEGLVIHNIVVILDRRPVNERGDIEGVEVHSLFKLEDLEIDIKLYKKLYDRFITGSLSHKLATIMYHKETNLVLSADVTTSKELLELADLAGPYICMIKTHIDIVQDFDQNLINKLLDLSKKHKFMIMEDKKFADIGNTVYHQYTGGIYKIIDWADFVTVHSVMGYNTFQSIDKAIKERYLNGKRGVFILAGASSDGNLINNGYSVNTLQIALRFLHNDTDLISGFIAQENIKGFNEFFYATPGVNIENKNDGQGQTYNTPETVVKKGSDLIIVGRGIYNAYDKSSAIKEYQQRGWKALIESYL